GYAGKGETLPLISRPFFADEGIVTRPHGLLQTWRSTVDDERSLIDKLRAKDESAFTELVKRHYSYLFRLANFYVSDQAVAQEVVQEAWIAILKGIDRFEERSSFKTWISRIVMNLARTRAVRENRSVAFSEFVDEELNGWEPAVEPSRFRIASDEF